MMPQSGCQFTYTGVLNCGTTSQHHTSRQVEIINMPCGQTIIRHQMHMHSTLLPRTSHGWCVSADERSVMLL